MSDAWMPGIRYVRATADGGPLKGGAPRAVWQTLGADPQTVSARSAAQSLDQDGQASHLVWNPVNGETVQLIPIVRAARSLAWPESDPAASWADQAALAEVTAEGRVCVQICVVGFAQDPFTASPMAGLIEIMAWLDSWGVSRCWPAGPPPAFPNGSATSRTRRLWARGGHFGASQVPGLTTTGPGAIAVDRLTGRSTAPAATAPPATAPPATAVTPPRPDGRETHPDSQQPAAGYESDLTEFLASHVASAASLTRAR